MKELYSNPDFTRVGFYKSILDEAGIPNIIRNAISHNLMAQGVIYAELCVVEDEDHAAAMELLSKFHYPDSAQAAAADWRCSKCDAEVPGTFDSCWQCGAMREGSPESSEPAG